MAKLTLNTIGSRYGSIDALNDNFESIENALENTLSRDGTTPNTMTANLDMNSQRIINLPDGTANTDAINLRQATAILQARASGLVVTVKERATATSGQTVFNLGAVVYVVGANNLSVFVDGIKQYPGESYTETDADTVTFSSGLNVGAEVLFIVNESITTTQVPSTAVTYTPGGTDAVPTTVQAKLRESVSTADFGGTLPVMAQIQGVVGIDANSSLVLSGFHVPGDKGAGVFFWSPTTSKTDHNGGTVIDPGKTFPTDWTDSDQVTAWYTAEVSGTGCWVRQYDTGYLMAEWFGAQPWVIGEYQDSTLPFQQCANIADRGGSWKWAGRHRTTAYVEIPFKQTFGSFGQMTSVSTELFDPLDFQGVNTSADPIADQVDSAIFYDSATDEAFRCNEGAFANNFLLYGRGYSTTGMSLQPALPAEGSYVATSGLRHGKYIRVENVTVILFRQAFDSTPWTTGGDYIGDYYSQFTNCEVIYCYTPFRVGGSVDTFNTKVVNPRIYANQFGDFGNATRNFQVVGGSVEGFSVSTNLRQFTNLSFVGTYFETFDTGFNDVMFNVLGITTLTFRDCLAYLNYVSIFVSSGGSGQGTTVNYMTLNASGNAWWKTDATAGTVFSINTVPNTTVGAFGDLIRLSNVGSSLTYYTGSPTGTYSAPITIPV